VTQRSPTSNGLAWRKPPTHGERDWRSSNGAKRAGLFGSVVPDTLEAFKELEGLVLELVGELAFHRWRAGRAEQRLREAEALDLESRPLEYRANDVLTFEEAREWWKVSARTCERMRLPWSNPRAGRRLRRILFADLLDHYRTHQQPHRARVKRGKLPG
jgi:hypothetical protein